MANHGRSSLVWFALANLLLFLVAGCAGFFPSPTMTALAVSPAAATLTAEVGTPPTCPSGSVCTKQLAAIATFSDGSQSTVAASWQSSDSSIAAVDTNTGLVTATTDAGQATITAAAGTLTATASITVTLANLVSIQVTPSSAPVHLGGSQQFTAMGTLSGGGPPINITDSVTWAAAPVAPATSTCVTITNGANGGNASALNCTAATTADITATSGNIVSNTAVLTVLSP